VPRLKTGLGKINFFSIIIWPMSYSLLFKKQDESKLFLKRNRILNIIILVHFRLTFNIKRRSVLDWFTAQIIISILYIYLLLTIILVQFTERQIIERIYIRFGSKLYCKFGNLSFMYLLEKYFPIECFEEFGSTE